MAKKGGKSGSGKPGGGKSSAGGDGTVLVAANKKARFQFEVIDTFEAGIVLRGTEVKSLRSGKASLDGAFGRIDGEEVFLVDCHIPEYSHGNQQNHDPARKRKLLLRKREIRRLKAQVAQKGLTLVPLELYFSSRGLAKVTLALCKGRKIHDKREQIRKKEERQEVH